MDILILTFIFYCLYLWLRKKALRVILGLLILPFYYIIAQWIDLPLSVWGLQNLWAVILLILVVIFQQEIREVLGSITFPTFIFEKWERLSASSVATRDLIKGAGPFVQYTTINFADGSTIIIKSQGTGGGTVVAAQTSGGWTSEIIKGTGRFEGIKGTQSAKVKYLPVEKGGSRPKSIW